MTDTGCQIVLTTCPDRDTGLALANALVDGGLAACVNILPAITSVYRWQGRTHSDSEQLLVIKSTCARYADIETRIRVLHPYELPEIIAVPISEGLAGYLAWLKQPE